MKFAGRNGDLIEEREWLLFGKPNIERMLEKRDVKGLVKVASKSWQHEELSVQASEALVTIGADAVEPLISILKNANEANRWRDRFRVSSQVVSQILGRIGDARAVEALIETLLKNDGFSEVQQSTAEALGRIGDVRAVEPLIEKIGNPVIRWHIANALGMIGEPAIERLKKASENLGDEERAYVVDVAMRALVEKEGVASTPTVGVSDSPKAPAATRLWLDSRGNIEISNRNIEALFGKQSTRAVAEETEVEERPKLSDAQRFVCSECGEEIPNAVRYEPPDLTMRCSGVARQCSCGWTCCMRCDPTYDQPDNGHDCPRCGRRRSGWVQWEPYSHMSDVSGWIQIDGDTDRWFEGGLWKRWKEDRESDRWTTIRRDLAKRLNLQTRAQ
jgi:hypothetical protein